MGLAFVGIGCAAPPALAGCEGPSPSPDPRGLVEKFDAVAVGRVVRTNGDGRRILGLSRVLKGNPPAEINIGPAPEMCGDGVDSHHDTGLYLDRTSHGWEIHVASVSIQDLAAAVRPLFFNGTGHAALVELTSSRRNPLVTLDVRGDVVTSARGGHRYVAQSVCPGGHRVIAWRSSGASDLLALPSLRRLGSGPRAGGLPPQNANFAARCLAAGGHSALASFAAPGGDSRVVLATPSGGRTLLRLTGRVGIDIPDSRHVLVTEHDEPQSTLSEYDATAGHKLWTLRLPSGSYVTSVASDGRHAAVCLATPGTLDSDSGTGIVDLQARPPHLRRIAALGGCATFLGSRRLLVSVDGRVRHTSVTDLNGHRLARLGSLYAGSGSLQIGPWIFVPVLQSLERVPARGGTPESLPLALYEADVQSLTG